MQLDTPEDPAINETICEVQVTSIASHVFNELEHGVGYKAHGVEPGQRVRDHVEDLRHASRLLDRAAERLVDERATEMRKNRTTIESGPQLRLSLERILERPVKGEVGRLYHLLSAVIAPLTVAALEQLDVPKRIATGTALADSVPGIASPPDEVVALVLGLQDYWSEFEDLAASWRGPTTLLKQAILAPKGPA